MSLILLGTFATISICCSRDVLAPDPLQLSQKNFQELSWTINGTTAVDDLEINVDPDSKFIQFAGIVTANSDKFFLNN